MENRIVNRRTIMKDSSIALNSLGQDAVVYSARSIPTRQLDLLIWSKLLLKSTSFLPHLTFYFKQRDWLNFPKTCLHILQDGVDDRDEHQREESCY